MWKWEGPTPLGIAYKAPREKIRKEALEEPRREATGHFRHKNKNTSNIY